MPDGNENKEYDAIMELERLESLLEDMDDLGIETRAQLTAKIAELHQKLDEVGE